MFVTQCRNESRRGPGSLRIILGIIKVFQFLSGSILAASCLDTTARPPWFARRFALGGKWLQSRPERALSNMSCLKEALSSALRQAISCANAVRSSMFAEILRRRIRSLTSSESRYLGNLGRKEQVQKAAERSALTWVIWQLGQGTIPLLRLKAPSAATVSPNSVAVYGLWEQLGSALRQGHGLRARLI